VRLVVEIGWVRLGGHCRFAQPMGWCGTPLTSLDQPLALPGPSTARTTKKYVRALSRPVTVKLVPWTGAVLALT